MFVSVKFRNTDARTYTYEYDLPEELTIGAKVYVETKYGRKVVEVVGMNHDEPSFACKPIVAIFQEEDE